MTESTYDYTFACSALQALLPGQNILVTQWRGTEAVSQPYRFEVTVAVRGADLALETLLDQPATLGLRKPDGSAARWHGIITQGGQYGHDETYDYYHLVLEPRLARLGLRSWSDVFLDQQLDDLIVTLLGQAQLTEKYYSDEAPYDYRIAVPDQALASMRREFACQFEESCLDFLKRKLEFYGVYFWFEQGEDRESIVFGNDVSQQPSQVSNAIYYPKGALDPDIRQIALTRMDRHVAMRPATVTLHALHEPGNVRLDMRSGADVVAPFPGQGEVHSIADHFSVVDDVSASDERVDGTSASGANLAQWRAQELACRSLGVQGEARTPGMLAGCFVAVSEYQRQSNAAQYYVLRVEHEGVQTLDAAPTSDEPAYRARFTALPRWQDQPNQSDPIQFRPSRSTPVPHITRLMSGFVDMDPDAGAKRYAQPDGQGRYKVRLPFVRQSYGGYRNSAWLRMSSPYAGGASQQGLAEAGMHFPLREGTEVLISFLNGDPDQPVIVGALPNAEAPSVVTQGNARQHVIRTPAGSYLAMQDGDPPETDSDSEDHLEEEADTYIRLSTTNPKAMLNLGTVPEGEEEEINPGFLLAAENHAEIYGGKSILIEVPDHYRVCAGSETAMDKFLGSERTWPWAPWLSVEHSGGVVFENFTGAKFELAESIVANLTFGLKTENFIGGSFESQFGFGASISWVGGSEINLKERKMVINSTNAVGRSYKIKRLTWSEDTIEREFKTLTYKGDAYKSYTMKSPLIKLMTQTGEGFSSNIVETTVTGTQTNIVGELTGISGSLLTEVSTGDSKLKLDLASATLSAPAQIELKSAGVATVNGSVIKFG